MSRADNDNQTPVEKLSEEEKISRGLLLPKKPLSAKLSDSEIESYIYLSNLCLKIRNSLSSVLFHLWSACLASGFFNEVEISRRLLIVAAPISCIFFFFYGFGKEKFLSFSPVSEEIINSHPPSEKLWRLTGYFFELFVSKEFKKTPEVLRKKYSERLFATYPNCRHEYLRNALNSLVDSLSEKYPSAVSTHAIKSTIKTYLRDPESPALTFVPQRGMPRMG